MRDGIDSGLVRARVAPLSTTSGAVRLRGYLRHRSFLASVAHGHNYEASLDELFVDALTPDAVVIDAGAHIGLYALIAAPRVPDGEVLAFEPDPYNRAALQINVERSGASNVRVLPAALADRVGEATFHASVSTIGSSLVARTDIPQRATLTVATTTIDEVLAGRSLDRLVIKLDLEGAEPLALLGATESVTRASSVALFVEIHPLVLERAGSSGAELVARLRSLGLHVVHVDRAGGVHEIDDANSLQKANLYASRGI